MAVQVDTGVLSPGTSSPSGKRRGYGLSKQGTLERSFLGQLPDVVEVLYARVGPGSQRADTRHAQPGVGRRPLEAVSGIPLGCRAS